MSRYPRKQSITTNYLLIGAATVALICGLYFSSQLQQSQIAEPELVNASLFPVNFRPLPQFELFDHNQQAFTPEQLQNRWTLLFFGFTYCPDVCPMTMATLQQAMAALDTQKELIQTQVVLVSVDPKRDTAKQLKDYVTYFNPEFIGTTGSEEQLQKLTKGIGVFYSITPNPDDPEHYSVDHSASVFVINPEGRLHARFSAPYDASAIINDLPLIKQHYSQR